MFWELYEQVEERVWFLASEGNDQDPAIFGARPKSRETKAPEPQSPQMPQQPESRLRAVESSNPLDDFRSLLTQPRRFFEGLAGNGELSGWVWGKALGGLLVFAFLSETIKNLSSWGVNLYGIPSLRNFEALHPWFNDQQLFELEARARTMLVTIQQTTSFVLPLTMLLGVVISTASVQIFLPWFGQGPSSEIRGRISFHRLFVALCFAQWLIIFAALPYLGWLWNAIGLFVFQSFAIKWIYRQGFWRSAMALSFIGFLGAMLALMVVAVVLGIFFSSGAFPSV